MNILNRIGGAFALLGLGIAVILGFQTPTGRQFWDGVWQAGVTVVDFVRDQISRLSGGGSESPDHDASLAIAIAAVGVIVVLALLKKPVSVRAFTVLVILATIVAFILYNPAVVG